MRRLLAVALGDPRNTRFVFLSESCIPIYDFGYTRNYLLSTYRSFVRGVAPGAPGQSRWSTKYLPLVPREHWRKGSKWVVLTRRAASLVVRDTEYYPLFRKLCTYTAHCYPEEHYLQTMLARGPGRRDGEQVRDVGRLVAGGPSSLAFRGEGRGGGHGGEGAGEGALRAGGGKAYCYLFACKFKNDTIGPLLRLQPQFGFY